MNRRAIWRLVVSRINCSKNSTSQRDRHQLISTTCSVVGRPSRRKIRMSPGCCFKIFGYAAFAANRFLARSTSRSIPSIKTRSEACFADKISCVRSRQSVIQSRRFWRCPRLGMSCSDFVCANNSVKGLSLVSSWRNKLNLLADKSH